jgi:hypothetical protein
MNDERATNAADGECLLTYLPSTYPTPLQVSTPQTPVTGILNTAALNESGGDVYCNQILIGVPVGTGPDQQSPFKMDIAYSEPVNYEEKAKTLIGVLQDTFDQKISREDHKRLMAALLDFRSD